MLQGERVALRAVERDDLKRLHELRQNIDLVLLGLQREEWQAYTQGAGYAQR